MATTDQTSDIFIKNSTVEWEYADEGIERKILGYDGELMLVRAKFEQDAVGQAHSHPHRQVTYVESGKFEVHIDGDTETLQQGDSFYVPPHAEHGAVAVEAGILLDIFNPVREDFL
ncbi:MAG: cupin domain-containing protein [Candidatus Marinimicrobia bacterium]|nr:cupin domain-containing protein [Candidatus Neomarinimicrobiota bacterium]MCF7828905.1 cupin domain-containing protein [Candidatus Neomarinimicrobiota bacterium]MCF7879865.1 cupin domain-containing protein [Candidatus Neomarinimicrobiota bacterium]